MVTFDANHIFTTVVNLHLGKPKFKQACFHYFARLPTIHNKNGKINIKIHNNAKIQDLQHTKLLWPCDASLK
jgi:hypothetical protein